MGINQSIKPITTKVNNNGNLEIGGCDLVELAEKYETPLYIMDEETLRGICQEYKQAFSKYSNVQFLYASKALCTKAISKIIASEGFGFDIVSGGELYTLYKAGVNLKTVLFNGNNKSVEELDLAVKLGIGRFSVDNFLELSLLNEIAKSYDKTVDILLRITPGIECHTHEYIKTGHLDSKFGFDLTQIDEAVQLIIEQYQNLNLKGLHAHMGSQIFETAIFDDEIDILMKEIRRIKDVYDIELTEINTGGGLGVKYTQNDNPPTIFEIAEVLLGAIDKYSEHYGLEKPKIYLEPGRSIVSTAGVTIYTMGSSKQVPNGKKYISPDGGMADNPRPSMYQAKYTAQLANKPSDENLQKVTIAGRFCESGDVLIEDILLPEIQEGDVLCVFNTGAYNYSMSSNYNRVPKPAMILVNNSQSDIIIKRESLEDLISHDVIPARLGD